jgi:hypothetical protein
MEIKNPDVDGQLCKAIVHEIHSCRDSFDLFRTIAEQVILQGHRKEMSYRAYNAYSSFILHLYEFLIAINARDLGVTEIKVKKGQDRSKFLDALVQSTTIRVVKNRIFRIENGIAPDWENHISYYEDLLPIPPNFAEGFRRMRNEVAGHVTYKRIQEINLTKFYEENHPYLYLLFRDCGDWWTDRSVDFPDFEQITDFLGSIARELHTQNKKI